MKSDRHVYFVKICLLFGLCSRAPTGEGEKIFFCTFQVKMQCFMNF